MRRGIKSKRIHLGFTELLLAVFVMVLGLLAVGCGGGGSSGGGVDPIAAFFQPSGSASSANRVRMTGSAANSTTATVNVVIGGPTTSQDLYSFAFDIVISNTSVAEYVSGSASFGTALTLAGGQGSSVLASQVGNRVVVGVTKTGGGSGNGVGAGEKTVLSLNFRILAKGSSSLRFEGSPSNPQNPSAHPVALDSAGNVVGSVSFDSASAQVGG